MPTRSAIAPRGVPVVLAILGFARFPEHEVGDGVFFVFIGIGALVLGLAEIKLTGVEVGELAVFRERGDLEINGTIAGRIGVAFFDQLLDHGDLLRDVIEGTRFDVWGQAVEGGAVVMEFAQPVGGEVLERLAGGL